MVLATAVTENELVEQFVSEFGLPPFALDVLLSIEDCKVYEEQFHGTGRDYTKDLMNFRAHQIKTSMITLDTFSQMCYDNKVKEAFEETFKHRFSEDEIAVIKKSLVDGKQTVEVVYAKFQSNPSRNIMRYFKG